MAEQGKGLRWCIYPDCQFYTKNFQDLENHWVEAHGAKPRKAKEPKQPLVELFDRSEYLD